MVGGCSTTTLRFAFIAAVVWGLPAHAQTAMPPLDENLLAIERLLAVRDEQLDLARAKLTIDRMIDPGTDVDALTRQLDAMAAAVAARVPRGASGLQKLQGLRSYLYEAGPWNNHRPFRYDLDDPLGRDARNKLLATYLGTRKGNCVSMPILIAILGQKIGIDVTLASAPLHILVKFRDDNGGYYNVEATSGGGFVSEAWIRKNMPITDEALANGIYLSPLSRRESVILMAGTLMEFYGKQGQHERCIALATMALRYQPKSIEAMLHMHAASGRIIERDFRTRYATPRDIPLHERARYRELDGALLYWRARAEELGWRAESDEANAAFLRAADAARSNQTKGGAR